MLFKKIFIIFIVFASSMYSPLNLYSFTRWNVLSNNGYKIHYSNRDCEYALNLSADIENNFIKIKNFTGYEPEHYFNIYLIQRGLKESITSFFNTSGGVKVYVDEDYNKTKNRIWTFTIDETISLLHNKSSGFSIKKSKGYESWLSQILAHYLMEGFTSEDDMVLRSLIDRQLPLSLNPDSVRQFPKIELKALHLGFIHFVTQSYGKNLLISALNNISYCGGFLKSLEFISGRKLETIEADFNNFFVSRYSKIIKNNFSINKTEIIELNNYRILSANQKGGILAYNNLTQNIDFLFSDSNSSELNISASIPFKAGSTDIIHGSFYDDNKCIITITEEHGTLFYFYNITDSSLKQKIFIPYLFLRELSRSHFTNGIVFSGSEGRRNDIFILYPGSMEIVKVTNGKGFYCYPAVLNKEKIIFVEKSDKNNIYSIERTGENMALLWETRNTLKDIAISENGDVYFSWNVDEVFNIYKFNISEKKAIKLTDYNTGAFNPLVYKNNKIIINIYLESKYKKALINNYI